MTRVFFVGAGPGDPELITVKGRRLLESADLVIYTGSLVPLALVDGLRARVLDSASMTLDVVIAAIAKAVSAGERVIRLHTGDPSIYGAIREQMARLDELGISYEVVPGVSSVFASAAALRSELTLPEVTQTVIITRRAGRTPVPESECIRELARHGSTMMILLSVSAIDEVVAELVDGGYAPETPVAVVEKASWPDERVIRGTLAGIATMVRDAGIAKTAIIAVGRVFDAAAPPALSKLYDSAFSHGCRGGASSCLSQSST
jgi:precorrin-4/cobalt-precorrin-4 C11-methyltransferase